jgi:epoxyqueuosine reductase
VVALPAALRAGYFRAWLAAGRHGDMHWLARAPERRLDPELVLPGARALFVCGYPYLQEEPPRRGRIAKYALGRDYHNLLLRKLKVLCGWLRAQGGVNRPYVDTGPLLEKELGALAGIGWIGKNTVLLNPREGQWLLLGCILTTLELAADAPVADRCGTCTRCIDVCPTGAITAPYQLDARRCISYLTIEHRGPIPEELRPLIGDHLFGCDDCLDVCPWNRWALASHEAAFAVRDYPDPGAMLDWDAAAFAAATAGTPLRRTGLARWKRNVSVVLGNTGAASDLPALDRAAADPDPLVAEHARWAAARIRGRAKTEGCKP